MTTPPRLLPLLQFSRYRTTAWRLIPIMKRLLLLCLVLVTLPILYTNLPVGIDWRDTYQPAALAVLHGQSPYVVEIYYAAPWAAWAMVPFAVLPYQLGRLITFLVGLGAFGYIAWRLGAKPLVMVLFLCSAAVVGCLNNGNIEWMPLLGIVLPPQIGLIFLAVKPQVGVGLGVYWLITIWNEKGWHEVTRVFAPVSVLLVISIALYGFWFLRFRQTLAWSVDNTSTGFYGAAVGAIFLIRAIRSKDERMALASGPLLSPYALQFTWSALLIYLLDKPLELLVVVIILWIPVILRVLDISY